MLSFYFISERKFYACKPVKENRRHLECIKMAEAPTFFLKTIFIGILLGFSEKERALDC